MFQEIVASAVERNNGHLFTVLTSRFGDTFEGMGSTEETNLDKVLHLLQFTIFEERGEGVSPSLNMRDGAEHCLDIVQCGLVVWEMSGVGQ